MSENFYGRDQEDNNRNNWEQQSSVYSYSYVNPTPGQDNPNVTSGYQNNSYYSAGTSSYQTQQPEKKNRKQNGSQGFAKSMIKAVALALVFGLVASGVFVGVVSHAGISLGSKDSSVVVYQAGKISATTDGVSVLTDVSEIVSAAMPSIVAITNTAEAEVQFFFGSQTQTYQSAGSGIIIGQDNEKIYLVTNNHVIDGTIDLKVTFSDNETVSAQVKGADAGSDLAVVTVNISDLKESTLNSIKLAVLGDSDECKVGEAVIAIGNALGYGQSVTTGVVSALNRSVTIENIGSTLMQTDAAINPGNSGGALLNSKGEVIGINSAKYSDTDVEGMGYAIPISDAKPIIDAIITREAVDETERGYIGIYGQDVTEDIASVYNMPVGIYILELVERGAAEQAGLHEGDIITAIDNFSVTTLSELQSQLQYYRAGQNVTITAMVKEGGTYVEKTYQVTLKKYSENP